jgi:polar amino acid transport system permease protein
MSLSLDFAAVLTDWPLLLQGVAWTLGLTALATVLGVSLGIVCAWTRVHGHSGFKILVMGYVELIRNTPFIVQLFFIFFGLPAMGVRLSPEWSSVLAMVINLGAYSAEIVRAGVQATPQGQIEAALSLALTRRQIFLRVVLPPALKRVWPALVSQIIIVMLGSAVCGQISTPELSYAANLIQSRNFRTFEAFIVAAALYMLLAISLRAALNALGQRFLFGARRA